MSISGYGQVGGIQPADEAEVEEAASGAGEGAPVEAEIVRGSSPKLAPEMTGINAEALQQQLEAAGVDSDEAHEQVEVMSETAHEISDTSEEIQQLEEELAMWQDYAASLEDLLNDPTLDFWDMGWIQWDLADAQWEIATLEQQLGKLEGTLDDLVGTMGRFWDNALSTLDFMSKVNEVTTQQLDDALAARAEGRATDATRRREDAAEILRREKLRADLEDKGLIHPAPPDSKAVKDEIIKIRDEIRSGRIERNQESFEALRERLRELRESPA